MEIGICVPVHKDVYEKWRTIFCSKFIGSCHHLLGFHGAQIYNSNTYHKISISIERWHKVMEKPSLLPITVTGRYAVVDDMHNPENCIQNIQFLRNRFQITNKDWPFEKEPHIPAFVQDEYLKHGGQPNLMLKRDFIKYEGSI